MMTKEEKQLLFKDLCARLPYGVKCKEFKLDSQICTLTTDLLDKVDNLELYFRPMSSMTEEEKEELRQEHLKDEKLYAECITRSEQGDNSMRGKVIPHFAADWCNAHHFDYRGLIEKGLAIEAPNNMYEKTNRYQQK